MAVKTIPVLEKFEWQKSVIDFADAPAGGEGKGDAYIVGTGSGAFSAEDDNIARYDGSSWVFTDAFEGMTVYNETTNKLYQFVTEWTEYKPNVGHFTATITSDASWDSEVVPIWQAPDGQAVTITKVQSTVIGTSSPALTFNIEERAFASLASAGTDIASSDLSADADGTTTTSFSNAGIAANAHLVFTTGASAATGTVDLITITVFYSW